ncbi:MAG: GNAT family N-acetyltransferase [Desulfuromonadales bacterium]|nr:GNAT family N-acetyltransferase [Desulfuromonadales bacterium]
MNQVRMVVAQENDWRAFLTLAAAEGWRVPQSEIAFHRRPGHSLALALRRGEETIGFVTAVPHQKSGWIGNLLVRQNERGQGLGARLFDAATEDLKKRGAGSLWLTASRLGEALYARRGFHPHGQVLRWVRSSGGEGKEARHFATVLQAQAADKAVWRESRENLLAHLSTRNVWLAKGGSVALLQHDREQQIIGPWLKSGDGNGCWALLDEMVAVATPGRELVIDAIDSPGAGRKLLSADFTCAGETLLMAAGATQGVRLDQLYALASLGSIG